MIKRTSECLQELGYFQTYVYMKYMWAYFHIRLRYSTGRKKKVFHSKLQFNWQTYLERFTDWWLNEHAHISFLSVFLNIKLHVSFLSKNNNNLSSGQLVRFLLSFWTEVASSPSQSCRSLPSLSVKWIDWLDN